VVYKDNGDVTIGAALPATDVDDRPTEIHDFTGLLFDADQSTHVVRDLSAPPLVTESRPAPGSAGWLADLELPNLPAAPILPVSPDLPYAWP
jgi:hypothetical protein